MTLTVDLLNQAVRSYQVGHLDEAEGLCRAILRADANHVEALYLLGVVQSRLGRSKEALVSYDKALAIKADYAEALNGRGLTLQDLKRFEDALVSYDKALAIKPDFTWALYNRGNTLRDLKRLEEALASYDRALAIKPDFALALDNRGNALRDLKRFEDAVVSYDRALAIKPDYAEALHSRGNALRDLNRFEDAFASYNKTLAIKPDHLHAFAGLADTALKMCDWTRTAELDREIEAHVTERKSIITPFTLLGYCSKASLQLKCAKNWMQHAIPVLPPPLWSGAIYQHERVRIAYLSADFRRHVIAYPMARL